MRHITYILLFTLLLFWVVPSHATTNVGTAGAQFLKIGPGAASRQSRRRIWWAR